MVEVWWSLIGAAVPALIAGQALRIKKRRGEEERIKSARGREKSSDEIFVCERVCTSKRMLKKVGAFSKDPIPPTLALLSAAYLSSTLALMLALELFALTSIKLLIGMTFVLEDVKVSVLSSLLLLALLEFGKL